MSRLAASAFIAAAALLVTSTAAFAAPNAMADADANLRKNPKNSSQAVNSVDEGELLTITQCQGSWCFAKVPGPDGWIKKNLLVPIDEDEEPAAGVPFNFGITVGPGGPSISIGVGSGAGGGGSSGPSGGPRACFFQDVGYAGASFCVAAGDSVNNLTSLGWNDAISSVRLYGGASVQVCEHAGFAGSCDTWGSNKSNLVGPGWNDIISSVDVF
jgi:hypothetical protein